MPEFFPGQHPWPNGTPVAVVGPNRNGARVIYNRGTISGHYPQSDYYRVDFQVFQPNSVGGVSDFMPYTSVAVLPDRSDPAEVERWLDR